MKIARQGYGFIIAGLLVGVVGLVAFRPWGCGFSALGFLFAAFSTYFFRDPERGLPTDTNKLYSTGDGRILSVAREGPGDIITIRTFLSVFDVHIQRNPCSGKVDGVTYQPGSFAAAMRPEASQNERSLVRLLPAGKSGQIVYEQIAGLIARRIETWCKPGDNVVAGDRYGIIYFGSQAAVHMPASCKPLVKPGDRVVGGVTPIAEWTA